MDAFISSISLKNKKADSRRKPFYEARPYGRFRSDARESQESHTSQKELCWLTAQVRSSWRTEGTGNASSGGKSA
jgi:hypothetical protein